MKLTFVDIETTGLAPLQDVWEIALLLEDPNLVVTSYRWTLKPSLDNADPAAMRLTRFYDRGDDLPVVSDIARFWLDGAEMDATSVPNAMWHLAELTAGTHLVGCNPAFDALRLELLMRRHGVAPAWHYHLIDVEALIIGYLAGRGRWPGLRKIINGDEWRSSELAAAVGVPPHPYAHTALADARWARSLYYAVMGDEVLTP